MLCFSFAWKDVDVLLAAAFNLLECSTYSNRTACHLSVLFDQCLLMIVLHATSYMSISKTLNDLNITGLVDITLGNHRCYVTLPARASLSAAKIGSWMCLFQLGVARSLAAQVVLAVEYAQSQGVGHGDLHLGNILLELPQSFDHFSMKNTYEGYG